MRARRPRRRRRHRSVAAAATIRLPLLRRRCQEVGRARHLTIVVCMSTAGGVDSFDWKSVLLGPRG